MNMACFYTNVNDHTRCLKKTKHKFNRFSCELLQQRQCLLSYVKTLKVSVGQTCQILHVQKIMCEKKSEWKNYLGNLFVKRRQPAATNVSIFLLSDDFV